MNSESELPNLPYPELYRIEGTTTPQETFLEMLYHHEERHTLPVVDLDFIKAFRALDEDQQYKAMSHIKFLSLFHVDQELQQEVYQGRLSYLYQTWFKLQTEDWVYAHYESPIDDEAWIQSMAKSAAKRALEEIESKGGDPTTLSLDEAKELIAKGPEVGQESAYEDAVINAFLGGEETER